jgi:hypothetical protein
MRKHLHSNYVLVFMLSRSLFCYSFSFLAFACSEGSGADAAPGTGTAAGVVAAAALLQPSKAADLASYGSGSGADGGWQRFGLGGDADECGSSCEGSIVDAGCVPVSSLLDSALLAMWEERAEQGLFR